MQVSWRSEQTRSTSSQPRLPVLTTHTVLPGPVNLWSLFPRTYFFLPGAFFRKTFFRRNQVASLRVCIVDCQKLEPPRGVEYLAKTFWSWPRAECRGRRSATRQRRRGQAGAVPAPARDARQVWCTPHGRARSVGGASLRPAGADRPKVRQRRDLSRRRGCGRGRSGAVGVRPYAAGDA